jgi:antitoxin FitA
MGMANVTIKGIPDDLYERIKQRAAAHRRSINQEIIVSLEQSVGRRPIDPEAVLADIDRFRESLDVPPVTDEFINRAKNWGRP